MGSILGRNRTISNDPFYTPVPPIGAYPPQYDPTGELGLYGPGSSQEYTYRNEPTSMGNLYGRPITSLAVNYGGRYAQGLNQAPGMAPWNYGNYYLGNTTMQMMPMMLNKVHQYGQMQAMSALSNAGILGSTPPIALNMPMVPSMPCCMPPSCNMPMSAPMMAAATALPVAFNPLVQGMYPAASMSPVNWMCPSSFMSALTSGPMPYRPPAYDFPNNVGMVMTIPYGTPNPMISATSYGASYNCGASSSWCCSYSYTAPAPAPQPICYYPRPVSVPQPYAVPCPYPVAIPNIQQVPVPQPVTYVAPPIVADYTQAVPYKTDAPLWTSQDTFTNTNFSPPAVMASNQDMFASNFNDSQPMKGTLPVYNAIDQSQLLIGQQITSSLSNSDQITSERLGVTPSKLKYGHKHNGTRNSLSKRIRHHLPTIPVLSNFNFTKFQHRSDPVLPPILSGYIISDSGWIPKNPEPEVMPPLLGYKKRKRLSYTNENGKSTSYSVGSHVSFLKRRHPKDLSSSTSEYDCVICQQEREKKRLRKHYNPSTVSSLLSLTESSNSQHNRHLSSYEPFLSSKLQAPASPKKSSHKSHRRHEKKIKNNSNKGSRKSTSPVLVRQTPIQDQRENKLKQEEKHDKGNSFLDDNDDLGDLNSEKSDGHASQFSLRTVDE
ncbi:unnamed protein product [Rotaria socialis]|uniref:Uncharacterized protein n=2 Tax=Rotaria socialis TaxID=392032 RepID=A0A818XHB1_9BILA|nr:unnamed protein product [Rotaria socialis]CAF3739175.1 unnamed protein product [Rotaria socialis]CAF4384155.1 unnamed protein product [Rotaria socialis]